MIITTSKTIEEKVEVTLPAFIEHGYSIIKIISEEKSIIVRRCASLREYSISYFEAKHPALNSFVKEGKEITEEEFDLILIDTKSKINAFIMESYLIAA